MPERLLLVFSDRDSHQHFMFKRLLKRGGFSFDQFDYAYAWESDLYEKLKTHKVAVAMGLIPLRSLIGESQPFRWLGKHTVHPLGTIIVGGMDPVRLLPNRSEDEDEDLKDEVTRSPARFTAAVVWAIRKAQRLAAEGLEAFHVDKQYIYDPSPEKFGEWVEEALGKRPDYLSWDIETPYKASKDESEYEQARLQEDFTIIRISFAYEFGRAVSIPWDAPFLPHIKRIFKEYSGAHVGWNSYSFDIPYLMNKGYEFGGTFIDGMDAWHWLMSDSDKGLEPVSGFFTDILPWKHLSKSEPAHYSCIDSDAALRNTYHIINLIKETGGWESYQNASINLMMPVLYEAGRRGVTIDKVKQDKLRVKLNKMLETTLINVQSEVPKEFKRFKPYSRMPKIKEGETWEEIPSIKEQRYCSKCEKVNVSVAHPCIKDGSGRVEKRVVSTTNWIQVQPPPDGFKTWVKHNGFNPNSADQLRRYIRGMGHPLGQNHKNKNSEESVDILHLMSLKRRFGAKFPAYNLFIEAHKLSKAIGQYVDGLAPDEKSRIYTTYTNTPTTWRLSSQNVNTQNISKRAGNKYAKEARETIVASPGNVLLQVDSSAVEAVMTAWFMQDSFYMELAKKGVHSYLVCKYHGWPFDDEHIKMAKASEWYDRMKRTVHMCLAEDHEVLTPTGWIKIKDYKDQEIAQWDNGKLEFVKPTAFHQYFHNGEMVSLSGTSLSAVMTPNHRVPYRHKVGEPWQEKMAKDLPTTGKIPSSGVLEGVVEINHDFLRLVVATQADGAIGYSGAVFHLVKQRKIERLLGILDRLNIPYTNVPCSCHKDGVRIRLNTTTAHDIGAMLEGKAKTFHLPAFLELSRECRQIVIDELPYWDGSKVEGGQRKRFEYFTTNKQQAVNVQTIACSLGKQALLRKRACWNVSFNQREFADISSLNRETIKFSGDVYCFTVPSSYFLTKHNDRISVTGNSNYKGGYRLLFHNYEDDFITLKNAKICQQFLFDAIPQLDEWQHQVMYQAQKECYLESPWKHRHYFYDVFSYKMSSNNKIMVDEDGKPLLKYGKDAKRAIGYKPQHSNGMFHRENLGIVGRSEFGKYLPANCANHDSITLDIPEKLEPIARQFLINTCTRPIPQMGNLRIGCGVELGINWGGYHEEFNPEGMKEVASVKV